MVKSRTIIVEKFTDFTLDILRYMNEQFDKCQRTGAHFWVLLGEKIKQKFPTVIKQPVDSETVRNKMKTYWV